MKRLAAMLTLALAGATGCGGGEKGGDTTTATSAPARGEAALPAAGQTSPPRAGEETASPAVQPPAGGGLTEQLAQAEKVWAVACSLCHGDDGEGRGTGKKKVPAVVGAGTLANYETGADLLTYVATKMPKDDPHSLPAADYLAVTAWLLSKNGKLGATASALTAESATRVLLK